VAAVDCFVDSKNGKDCHDAECPSKEQCEMNIKGNCVWAHKKQDRPLSCENCNCKKQLLSAG